MVTVSGVPRLSIQSGVATVSRVPRLSKLSVDIVRVQEMPRQVASSNESALYVAAWLGTLANQPRIVDESRPSPSTQRTSRPAPHKDRMMRCMTTLTRVSESAR